MLLRVETRLAERKKCKHGKRAKPISELTRIKKVYVLQCDQCRIDFERPGKEKFVNAEHHFCSAKCRVDAQKIGGVLCNQNPALIRSDVLKRANIASHSEIATQRRSHSLREYHQNRPIDWQNPGNTPEACIKRHETMKRNGTYRKSSVEDQVYDYLCSTFGDDQVERNVMINDKWPIDFYVKSIDTYIQLDGVYWHGLDRPIEEIAKHKTPRDAQIHKKWMTDRAQDAWFKERGMTLKRLTDVQFLRGERLS